MANRPSLDDYIDVAERIMAFSEKYPEGSLQTIDWSVNTVGEQTFIVYRAAAYRTPHDPRPGHGIAWEPFPGATPYTRNSELMNAETAAWGRAIVAVGLAANRKIASKQEVKARQGDQEANGTAHRLSEDEIKAVVVAVKHAEMPHDWIRMQLIASGAQNVPDGEVKLGTLRALTSEQAAKVIAACEEHVASRVAA